jgi:hypothetical protein
MTLNLFSLGDDGEGVGGAVPVVPQLADAASRVLDALLAHPGFEDVMGAPSAPPLPAAAERLQPPLASALPVVAWQPPPPPVTPPPTHAATPPAAPWAPPLMLGPFRMVLHLYVLCQ